MNDIQSIQNTIKDRAINKLNRDIEVFLEKMHRNELYNSILIEDIHVVDGTDKETLRSFLWPSTYGKPSFSIGHLIFEKLLPKYIESETKLLFERFDDLLEQEKFQELGDEDFEPEPEIKPKWYQNILDKMLDNIHNGFGFLMDVSKFSVKLIFYVSMFIFLCASSIFTVIYFLKGI